MRRSSVFRWISAGMLCVQLSACVPQPETGIVEQPAAGEENVEPGSEATPLPRREQYFPGQLVDYIARSGDTLPGLAAHFNTTIKEIQQANPVIPDDASTMPQGFPMKIPIYYQSLWGTPFQILPDSLFVYGPAQKDFDPVNYVKNQPGWFKNYTFYTSGARRTGGEIINLLAQNYSVSPRLLLALIEYQAGGLSQPVPKKDIDEYPLGFRDFTHKGLFLQLSWAANYLNNGYYDWRSGNLRTFDLQDGRLERPDPWQNAATVGLQYYFARVLDQNEYQQAISADGFFQTYKALFGDPWMGDTINIPGSLKQPRLHLPFPTGKTWTYTGGPHSPYGNDSPRAALDFAPPSVIGGCVETTEIVVAVADGIISRTDTGIAVLDLDGDGDERTGWVVFYLHLATADMVKTGTRVKAGDRMGRPSCEGGHATGTHIHIARKYNGEWIPADGPIPFDLEGWLAGNGLKVYLGTLTRYSRTVNACECSDSASQITSEVTCP